MERFAPEDPHRSHPVPHGDRVPDRASPESGLHVKPGGVSDPITRPAAADAAAVRPGSASDSPVDPVRISTPNQARNDPGKARQLSGFRFGRGPGSPENPEDSRRHLHPRVTIEGAALCLWLLPVAATISGPKALYLFLPVASLATAALVWGRVVKRNASRRGWLVVVPSDEWDPKLDEISRLAQSARRARVWRRPNRWQALRIQVRSLPKGRTVFLIGAPEDMLDRIRTVLPSGVQGLSPDVVSRLPEIPDLTALLDDAQAPAALRPKPSPGSPGDRAQAPPSARQPAASPTASSDLPAAVR